MPESRFFCFFLSQHLWLQQSGSCEILPPDSSVVSLTCCCTLQSVRF